MTVVETFFSLEVTDMQRATDFYVAALGATVSFASPLWSSLHIAGVRLGLFLHPPHTPTKIGLHFVVADLASTCAAIARASGRIGPPAEVAPGIVLVDATDTEGNTFTLRQA